MLFIFCVFVFLKLAPSVHVDGVTEVIECDGDRCPSSQFYEVGASARFKRASKPQRDDDLESAEHRRLSPDPRCNSERLREVIRSAQGDTTTALKRSIQALAEERLHARYNVICAEDDFSYITNTEEYCQDTVGHRTCYAFRQLNRSPTNVSRQRKRLRKFFAHRN